MTSSDFSKIEAGNISVAIARTLLLYYNVCCDGVGKMTIERVPFNVRLATEDVLDCVSFLAEERGVELVCDVSGPLLSSGVVLSNPVRFRQVLLNVLGEED